MSIIKNFGFMWDRDKVQWGSRGPGGAASFDGIMVGRRKRRVSFLAQMGIYVLYDRFEQPVQIGQARVIIRRLRQHRRDHLRNRWAYFTWFGFYQVGVNDELLVKDKAELLKRIVSLGEGLDEIEAVLIQVLEPRLNRRGPNWQDSEEYLQSAADAVEDDPEPIDEED
jgi:hypothetical protein